MYIEQFDDNFDIPKADVFAPQVFATHEIGKSLLVMFLRKKN